MKVEFEKFVEDYDVAVVVLSRDRAKLLKKCTDKILEGYHLYYSGEGYEDESYMAKTMHEVPRGIQGLSAVRNHVLDLLPNRIVIFIDDDIKGIYWVAGMKSIRLGVAEIQLALLNMTIHALDQGTTAFGMSPTDIRKNSPLVPFRLRAVFGTVLGVIGREHRFDERNRLKTDYDYCLEVLKTSRTTLMDKRYYALSSKDAEAGGNMEFRTQERRLKEIQNLVDWWGDDVVSLPKAKTIESLRVDAP